MKLRNILLTGLTTLTVGSGKLAAQQQADTPKDPQEQTNQRGSNKLPLTYGDASDGSTDFFYLIPALHEYTVTYSENQVNISYVSDVKTFNADDDSELPPEKFHTHSWQGRGWKQAGKQKQKDPIQYDYTYTMNGDVISVKAKHTNKVTGVVSTVDFDCAHNGSFISIKNDPINVNANAFGYQGIVCKDRKWQEDPELAQLNRDPVEMFSGICKHVAATLGSVLHIEQNSKYQPHVFTASESLSLFGTEAPTPQPVRMVDSPNDFVAPMNVYDLVVNEDGIKLTWDGLGVDTVSSREYTGHAESVLRYNEAGQIEIVRQYSENGHVTEQEATQYTSTVTRIDDFRSAGLEKVSELLESLKPVDGNADYSIGREELYLMLNTELNGKYQPRP
jgi:hypothetical protein